MKLTSKTPYEIRLDLLQLSFNILVAKHQAAGVANGNNVDTSPTTEEVVAEAEKMNMFISNAAQNH